MRSTAEVATVIEMLGKELEAMQLPVHALKTLRAIKQCRTAALGGHVDQCNQCHALHISYNSCRNRHCPKCQGHKRVQWIQKREEELLPTVYYHVVFTLPSELNELSMHQPRLVYDALFESAWQTVQKFGQQKGLQMGMIAILHTWGQNLSLHPHLHCIVPGGGVNRKGQFEKIHAKDKYLFSVKALSKVFRAKYIARLRQRNYSDKALIETLFTKDWVVYAKRPFGNPQSVIEYLGRYTHKVAISNQRIKSVTKTGVSFVYKDYKQQGVQKEMQLSLHEFVRRFAQHILPHRFVRIRHYGFLSSTWKRQKLKDLQKQLGVQVHVQPLQTLLHKCPTCKTGVMLTLEVFGKRGPPAKYFMATPTVACSNHFV
jgi:Putative transposase/Transposase zinc-binding domain